jgi:hypothetical protein
MPRTTGFVLNLKKKNLPYVENLALPVYYSPRNNPEVRGSKLLHNRSLKSSLSYADI